MTRPILGEDLTNCLRLAERTEFDHLAYAGNRVTVSQLKAVIVMLVTECRATRARAENPRATFPVGQRRLQLARRKRATRRK